jgi:hypothetical protein
LSTATSFGLNSGGRIRPSFQALATSAHSHREPKRNPISLRAPVIYPFKQLVGRRLPFFWWKRSQQIARSVAEHLANKLLGLNSTGRDFANLFLTDAPDGRGHAALILWFAFLLLASHVSPSV